MRFVRFIDFAYLGMSAYICAGFGVAVGSMIPIPGVGPLVGMGVGVLTGLAIDYVWGPGKEELKGLITK